MRLLTAARVSAGIAVAIAALRLLAPTELEVLDLKLLDLRYALRGGRPAGGEVTIVGIDESSLAQLGRWPWPRPVVAVLVDRLAQAGAAAIGFDVIFDQPERDVDLSALEAAVAARPALKAADLLETVRADLDPDARLARALRGAGNVVLGYFFEFEGTPAVTLPDDVARLPELSVRTVGRADLSRLERPTRVHAAIPVLASAAAGAGHINFLPDTDGLYRRLPLAVRVGDRLLPSFSIAVLRHYLGGADATVTVAPDGVREVRIGDHALPVDANLQMWVNYLGPPGTVRRVAAADVVDGRAPADAIAGRMVLVGYTAAGFDEIATPFAPVAPGIELQATVIDNLLHGTSLRRPWWVVPGEAAVILLVGALLGLMTRLPRAAILVAAAAAMAALYAWATQQLFVRAGLAVGALYPLAAIVLCTLGGGAYQATFEQREKRLIRSAFRLYLNPELADILARDPTRLRLGGERREVSVLFSDIRGFTGISERLEAEVLGAFLNEYLGAMTEVVFHHEGLLDKYIGDAVMAFWGAPVAAPDHARRCCLAALDMLAALAALHPQWAARGLPLLEIGIGINSGDAAVGNFGSGRRFAYTAVGDNVNLASRLQALNKDYGTRLLVSEATRRLIGEEFVCREIDVLAVRGRVQPVRVYELLGRRADDRDGRLARRVTAFESALAAYRREAWDEAVGELTALARDLPEDRAAEHLLARCRTRAEPASATS
jgi:adenylate cyclase